MTSRHKKEEIMEKEIYVNKEGAHGLMRAFKCTQQMVWQALKFKSDSQLARQIRFTALREFGGVASWKPAPMETTHDTARGIMVQDFGNGVVLAVSLGKGDAMLGIEKEDPTTGVRETQRVVKIEERLTIEGLMKLQEEAVRLSMSL